MPFDLVRDNVINVDDFVDFATVFGFNWKSMTPDPDNPNYVNAVKADYDKDGIVNVNDFVAFAMYYGRSKNNVSQPIPLPGKSTAQVSEASYSSDVSNNNLEGSLAANAAFESVCEEPIQTPAPAAIRVTENISESSLTLREAYTAALLDLYDNQNCVDLSQSADALSETRIEDLYRSSDDNASEKSPNAVAINAVLEEELLAIDWNNQ